MAMFDDPSDPRMPPRMRPPRMTPTPPVTPPTPQPPPPDPDLGASSVDPGRPRSRRPAPPSDGGATSLPTDIIGDIPPPPIPQPPIASAPPDPGIPGTLARPGSPGAAPFRTPAYAAARPPRFGPGAPIVGGAGMSGFEGDAGGMGLGAPDDVAELLRQLAAGRGPVS